MHKSNTTTTTRTNKHQQLHINHLGVTTCKLAAASNSQPLCKAGICNQSSGPASTTQTTNVDPTQIANVDPTVNNTHTSISQTATNSKPLTLTHQFISSKVVGPDRFRFINYYWTSSATQRAIDVGTSSGVGIGFGGGFSSRTKRQTRS